MMSVLYYHTNKYKQKAQYFFVIFLKNGEKTYMNLVKKMWTYLVIVAVAFGAAVNYELFVFPNQFAPSGINGICTMIQYIFGISLGYLSLLINLPLALLVFFKVSKPVAIRSMLYVVCFSVGLLILDHVDISALAYSTENGTSKILGPLTAGIVMGFCSSVLVKGGAYTGGTDFVSLLIHKNHPEKSIFGMTFTMNAVIAASSYFVYGFKMEPVLLCILYSFASSNMAERRLSSGRSAIRVEIVTDYPREISDEIIHKVHHTATLIPAKGMYAGKEKNVLMCVVNNSQIGQISEIIRKYPNTFAIMGQVSQVMGNFRTLSSKGEVVKSILDKGE